MQAPAEQVVLKCTKKIASPEAVLFKENDSLAQLVEQRPFKAWVLGSSPRGITMMERK